MKIKYTTLIILGCAILIGGAYFGFIKFQNYSQQKTEEKIEAERTKKQLLEQQKEIEKAQAQIENLQKRNEQTQKQQTTLEQKVYNIPKNPSSPKDLSISSSELSPYLTGVAQIQCADGWGSGTLWNLNEKYSNGNPRYLVLTNYHVIKNPRKDGTCIVDIRQIDNLTFAGIYVVIPNGEGIRTFNNETDQALLDLVDFPDTGSDPSFTELLNNIKSVTPKNGLNYRISTLPKCKAEMALGSPVVIIGYPASSQVAEGYGVRTITNGIISAYDSSVKKPIGNLPYVNYFVSAKIDSGNSGGITLSKDSDGKICVLGIPTWLTVGNYETQGLIQNINNIFYKQ